MPSRVGGSPQRVWSTKGVGGASASPGVKVSLYIAPSLRARTGGAAQVEVSGRTAGDALRALAAKRPAMMSILFDAQGRLARDMAVFVSRGNRTLEGPAVELRKGDELSLVPDGSGG